MENTSKFKIGDFFKISISNFFEVGCIIRTSINSSNEIRFHYKRMTASSDEDDGRFNNNKRSFSIGSEYYEKCKKISKAVAMVEVL